MGERGARDSIYPERRHGSVPARRSLTAALIAILVFLTQIGPALACDVFDGPGKPGRPALFHSDPIAPLGNDDRGFPDDCSSGPSYLMLEIQPVPLHPPLGARNPAQDADSWAPVTAQIFFALQPQLSEISAIRSPAPDGGSEERYAYLHTLRLRI